jgi:hypothetical protein
VDGHLSRVGDPPTRRPADLPCEVGQLTLLNELELGLARGEYESVAVLVNTTEAVDNEPLRSGISGEG